MLNIFILLLRGQHKVGKMLKGYLIMMGIIIIFTTLNYILVGLKYVAFAMVFIASLIVILYVLSVRYQHKNFIGVLSSNIMYYILHTKVSRAKNMLNNNNQHRAACDEIIFLFKNIRPNDAKFTYRQELKRVRLNLEKYKLDFDEEDEVLNPFKNWFYNTEKYFLNSYLEHKSTRLLNKR
jgi:hypothetical protein